MFKLENLRTNNKKGYFFILLLLLLVSNNIGAFETNSSQYSSHPGVNAAAKITVLITLDKEPLLSSFNKIKRTGKVHSLDTKQENIVRKALFDEKQRLIDEQSSLLQVFTAKRIPFAVKRRLQLITNMLVLEIEAETFDEVSALPGVKSVHKQRQYHTNLDNSVPLVKAPETWQLIDPKGDSADGVGIRVAIIDTGIDYMHPDLGGGFGPGFKVVGGWDFADNDDDPMDEIAHGTHVAGIVAANGELKGVAPAASLLAYKVFNAAGEAYDTDIIAAMETALDPDGDPLTDDGAHVINMSLGGPDGPDSPISQAADAVMDAGIIVVVSAGNAGGFFNVGSPGTAELVITVAATDNTRTLATFSSGGPVLGLNASKPEISAPGVDIRSTVLNGEYGLFSGTSMAAPHVAGAAALLRQLHPELSTAQIKHLLISSAIQQPGNIYREGVAALDIFAASEKALIISPPLLNLGEVGSDVTLWQKSESFNLQNISSESRDFKLTSQAYVIEGVKLELLSAQELTLAAGEIRTVNYQLEVDNNKLPVSADWPANFELEITISDNENTWRLPVTFHKSHRLSIDSDSALDFILYNSSDGSWAKSYPVDQLGSNVPVKSGVYKVFSLFAEEVDRQNLTARPLLISEAIDLTSTRDVLVNLSPAQANLIIGLNSYRNVSGETVNIDESNSLSFDIDYKILNVESDLSFSFNGVRNLVVNNIESSIQIRANGFVALQEDSQLNILTFNESWLQAATDHPIELDLSSMQKGVLVVDLAADELATITLRRWNNQDLLWHDYSYWDNPVSQFETQNFNTINIFGLADVNFADDGIFETGLELSFIKQSNNSHVSTQPFSFTEQGLTKFSFDLSEDDSWVTVPILTVSEMPLSSSSLFWTATTQVEFIGEQASLRIMKPSSEGLLGGLGPVAPIQDHWLNSYQQVMPYTLNCDQVEINSGELSNDFNYQANIYFVEASRDCEKLQLLVTYNNWLEGIQYQSSVETLLNSSRGESSLALKKVSILSATTPTSNISGTEGKIVVQLASSLVSSVTNFQLELKVEQGGWSTLSTEQNDNTFTANLESPTKLPQVASIRILVESNLGNVMTNNINGAFIYGTNDPMQLDSDDDGVADALDAFPNDPQESIDTDGDGIGNNTDDDDDGDQMPDSFELSFNLDPLDPSDAELDPDNDGLTNLEEYKAGRDPTVAEKSGGGGFGYLFLQLILVLISCRHLIVRKKVEEI